jgi:hypothetical protein
VDDGSPACNGFGPTKDLPGVGGDFADAEDQVVQ